MNFTIQLKTLLWKNYILRRKKPLRVLAELVWPLIIFTVLVLIRGRFKHSLITDMEGCEFEDFSLPSAGLLKFIQGIYCNIEVPCHKKVKEGLRTYNYKSGQWMAEDEIRHVFASDKIYIVAQEFENFFNDLKGMNLQKIISDLNYAIDNDKPTLLQCSIPLSELISNDTMSENSFLQNVNFSLGDLYTLSESFGYSNQTLVQYVNKVLTEICIRKRIFTFPEDGSRGRFCLQARNKTPEIMQEVFTRGLAPIMMKCLRHFRAQDFLRLMNLVGDIQNVIKLRFQLNNTLDFLSEFANLRYQSTETFNFKRSLCGIESTRNNYSFLRLLTSSGLVKPKIIRRKLFFAEENETILEFCQLVMRDIKVTKQFTTGKIFYTPINDFSNKVVKLANRTFEDVDKLITLLQDVKHLIPDLMAMSNSSIPKEMKILAMMYSLANITTSQFYLSIASPESLLNMLSSLDDTILVMLKTSKCFNLNKFHPIETEEELEKVSLENSINKTLLASLIFLDNETDAFQDMSTRYKLRVDQSFFDVGFKQNIEGKTKRGNLPINPRLASRFFRSGFVFVQDFVDHALIMLETQSDNIGSVLQLFPSPCYVEDVFRLVLVRTFPLFMTLAWLIMVPIIVKDIVYEKEAKLKEFMKVMGLSKTVHWLSWFLFYFVIMAISACTLAILFKFGEILYFSNIFLVILFMWVFVVALITQCFMFSVFFSNSNAAASFSAVAYFASFLPFRYCILFLDTMPLWQKLFASLSFTTAFGLGCNSLSIHESMRIGMQVRYLFHHPTVQDQYSFALSIFMMFFDSILYLSIALYVEAVSPGAYGQAKPWHFPVSGIKKWLKSFRSVRNKNQSLNNPEEMKDIGDRRNEFNKENLPVGVLIQNLTKRYEKHLLPAVNDLTTEFYDGQISGLLGHNGAGKTTTMFIITGILPPTQGTAYIMGLDVRTNIKDVRKLLSFCPQHNILHDCLTVYQHLVFYAKLRGMKSAELYRECDRVIADVELVSKKDVDSQYLSGGQKRRLSVGIAYLGSPKVVILDEPTAGVDARARRFIWDLLLKYKSSRTTILSTHLMEEAEVLSDRLVIINKGRLYASGSLMYLKNRFASGYRLVTEIQKESFSETLKKNLIDFVQNQVDGAEIDKSIHFPYGVVFILPHKSSDQFPNLFKQFEIKKNDFLLSNYGLTSPTVEEVFVNVNNSMEAEEVLQNNSAEPPEEDSRFIACPEFKANSGISLLTRQFIALIVKRVIYFRRNKKSIFCQLILPPLFIALMLIVIKYTLRFGRIEESKEMVPRIDTDEEVILNFFVARSDKLMWKAERVEKSLIEILGREDKCLDPSVYNFTYHVCLDGKLHPNISYQRGFRSNFSSDCKCLQGHQKCSRYFGSIPKNVSLSNGDIVLNLTHYDIADYLVKTRLQHDRDRFGGYEFVSKAYPTEGLVQIVVNVFNTTNSIAAGMNMDISSKTSSIIEGLKVLSPSLMKENLTRVWHDYEMPSSIASYLNAFHSALLRPPGLSSMPLVNRSRISISVFDHPFEASDEDRLIGQGVLEILPSVCIMFAMGIIPTTFLFFLIEERQCGFMHLQMISGVHSTLYWISNLIWDYLNYSLAALLCISIFVIAQSDEFVSSNNLPTFVVLLFSYGWAITPLTYPFVYLFKDANVGYIFTSGIYFFSGLIPTIIMFVFDFITKDEGWAETFRSWFMILPPFCLGRGLMVMIRNHMTYSSAVALMGKDSVEFQSPMAMNKTGQFIRALLLFGAVMLTLFLVIEYFASKGYNCVHAILHPNRNANNNSNLGDEDIQDEVTRILSDYEHNILLVRNVTKVYHIRDGCYMFRKVVALDNVTFGVVRGECFGLLGTNGAGKTTLFKILTRHIKPTSGEAYLNNINITKKNDIHKDFGYCPQFDALGAFLTVREHFILFSKLRGASKDSVKAICSWGLTQLDLLRNDRTLSKNLSGGNKRKLSVALALIGSPKLVYMDEPTAGIDPRARRSVWNCVLGSINNGQSVILTSHSLEECEALCTRVAIIVAGTLRCIGSIQHLKNKYSKGYTLNVKFIGDADKSEFEERLFNTFPQTTLEEQHAKFSTYLMSDTSLQLSKVFQILSDAKKNEKLEDFSITQTRLEHVFMRFAQSDPA